MAIGIGSYFGLLTVILFLLPGFAGIKYGLRVARRADWLNRIETIGLSFALSLVAMFALYLFASAIQSIGNLRWNFISATTVQNHLTTPPDFILIYLLLVTISLMGGYVLGKVDFGGKYFDPILPWAKFHELAERSGDGETYLVRVRTTAGEELRGKVEDEGEAALNKDIILEDPQRFRFFEDETIIEKDWTGLAYIHSQSIAHVEFDRLENADDSEVWKYYRKRQMTLDEITQVDDDEEIEQLEKLVKDNSDR